MPPLYVHLTRCALLGLFMAGGVLQAQNVRGHIGVGGQVGNPSGITIKLYKPTGLPLDAVFATKAIEFLAEWDLDRAYILQTSIVNEQAIALSHLRYFVGPGVVVGLARENRRDRLIVGLMGNLGINFFLERFEVFLHLSPQLDFFPRTNGFLGGGIGMRYFL